MSDLKLPPIAGAISPHSDDDKEDSKSQILDDLPNLAD